MAAQAPQQSPQVIQPGREVSASDFEILMLLVLNLLTMWRCDILSKRIDTAHKRMTLELSLNNLRSGWSEAEAEAATTKLFKRLRRKKAISSGDHDGD